MTEQAYPAYVESGVEWIGPIPSRWNVKPFFAAVATVKKKNADLAESNLLSLSYGNLIRKDIDTNEGLLPESFDTYQVIERDDIVFRFTDLQNDKRSLRSAIVRERGIITSAYLAVRPCQLFPEYLAYLMRAYDAQKVFYSMGGGLRQSMKFDDVKRLPILVPPVEEQRQIAEYLDRETGQIDELITKQEQLVATLTERRQAVITQAVTRGLDPTTELKESQSKWLGPIPKGWMPTSLKWYAEVQTGITLGKEVSPSEAVELPYLRVANVQVGYVNLDEVKSVSVARDSWRRHLLRSGDVLMTEGGDIDKLGRGSLWSAQVDPCIHQNHVFAVRCTPALFNRWLVYALDAPVARQYFRMTAKKTTNLASTNSTTVGELPISLPPISEQHSIVDFLDAESRDTDALMDKAAQVIALLRERRQALISAAVTGKIDVRGL